MRHGGAFFGRSIDLERLRARLRPGRVLVCWGLPGVGKTRLVDELVVRERTRGRWADRVHVLELPPDAAAVEPALERAAAWLFERPSTSRAPKGLLVVDGADGAHAALVACVTRRPWLAILATSRVRPVLADAALVEDPLGPLPLTPSPSDAERLLRSRHAGTSSARDARIVLARTGGLPGAIELAAVGLREAPGSPRRAADRAVATLLGPTLSALSPTAVDLARALACRPDAPTLAMLAWEGRPVPTRDVEALVDHGVVRLDDDGRVLLADALRGLLQSGPHARLRSLLVESVVARAHAARRVVHGEAVPSRDAWLPAVEQALRLAPMARLSLDDRLALGVLLDHVTEQAGPHGRRRKWLLRLLADATGADPALVVRLELGLADACLVRGAGSEGLTSLERAAARVGAVSDPVRRAALALQTGQGWLMVGQPPRALAPLRLAFEASPVGTLERVTAQALVAQAEVGSGNVDVGLAEYERALAGAAPFPATFAEVLLRYAMACGEHARLGPLAELVPRAAALPVPADPLSRAAHSKNRARIHQALGDLVEADRLCEEAAAAWTAAGNRVGYAFVRLIQAQIAWLARRDAEPFAREAEAVLTAAQPSACAWTRAVLAGAAADRAPGEGGRVIVEDHLARARAFLERGARYEPLVAAFEAYCAARAGRLDEARSIVARLATAAAGSQDVRAVLARVERRCRGFVRHDDAHVEAPDGRTIDLSGRPRLAELVARLDSPTPVSLAALTEALFPGEGEDPRAQARLRRELTLLRKLGLDEALEVHGGRYRLALAHGS